MSMQAKVAVVTGANRGLGRGLTEALARRGQTVLMVCRDKMSGQLAESELRTQGLDVSLFIADLRSPADIRDLADEVAALFTRVDVLANCAGVNLEGEGATLEDLSPEVLAATMETNFRGILWMCTALLPLLGNSPSGRIINFTSGLGRLSVPHSGRYPAYSISKTALNGLTKVLAAELETTNVLVFSVDPGWVRTEMGGEDAPLSVEEGVDTPLWLATAEPDELRSGALYHRREIISW